MVGVHVRRVPVRETPGPACHLFDISRVCVQCGVCGGLPPPITVHLTGYPNIQEWVVRRKTLRVRGPSRIRHDTSGPSRLVYVWYDILYRRVVRYDTPVARCRARTLTNLHVAYVTCICYTTLD